MLGIQVTSRFLLLLVFFAFSAFLRVEAQQTHASTSETSGPDFRSELEKETFILVNDYRKSNQLPLLTWDDQIAKVARAHSKDMATGEVDFGHEGFRERVSDLKNVMAGFRGAGENVLMTSDLDDVPRSAVALWLRSPHHLENIRGDYNYSGLGVWQDKDGTIYFTQIFLKFAPPAAAAQAVAPTGINTTLGLLASPYTRSAQ
jgi:uncharacterized protein YkwD